MTKQKKKLGGVCEISMGQSPSSSTYNDVGDGLPFYQGKKDFGTRHPTPRVWCSNPIKIVKAGDILISVRAPVGALNIATEKSCIGRGLAGLRAKKELNQDYLFHFLKLSEKDIASLGTGSTFTAISKKHLENLEIPLPIISEQKKIVAKLEKLFAKTMEAKRLRAETQKSAQNLLSSELSKIYEEGKRNGQEMVRVEDVSNIKGGKRLPRGHWLTSDKTDHPYIRVADLIPYGIDKSRLKYLEHDTFLGISRYTISKDDVFISIAGTIGATGVIPDDLDGANLTENAAKLTNLRNIEQKYLMYILTSPQIRSQISSEVIQTTISKFGLFRIAKLQFPLPHLTEQKKIVAHLDALSEKVSKLQEYQKNTVSDLDKLERSILSKAFEG